MSVNNFTTIFTFLVALLKSFCFTEVLLESCQLLLDLFFAPARYHMVSFTESRPSKGLGPL